MSEFFNRVLFSFGTYEITGGKLFVTLLLLVAWVAAYYLVVSRLLPLYFSKSGLERENRRKIRRILSFFFLSLLLLALSYGLQVDFALYESEAADFMLSYIIKVLLIFQFARILDFTISQALRLKAEEEQENRPGVQQPLSSGAPQQGANRIVQLVVYALALLLFMKSFELDFRLFGYEGKEGGAHYFSFSNIVAAVFILLVARLITWILIHLVLDNYYRSKQINLGSQYAINQLLQYFIYTIAILMVMEALGLTLTVLWGGAAALLVGLGLGLQETFKDFFSGIILLFERTVEVGDIVVVDGMVGRVKRIGLRTSQVETRDNFSVIVPNSRLVVENVINWSHGDRKARFTVEVGVAYGSDTALVKKLLLEAARENAHVLRHPPPFVRFTDFGDSSLDFELHFWSQELMPIENVKSDLRFAIDQAFREHGVTIPFPQRDVWMRGGGAG
jgi:small-conductance mechanosensitive channel